MCGLFSKKKEESVPPPAPVRKVVTHLLMMFGDLHTFAVTTPSIDAAAKWLEEVKNLSPAIDNDLNLRYRPIGVLYELIPPEKKSEPKKS